MNERPIRDARYAFDALAECFPELTYNEAFKFLESWQNTDNPVYAQIQLDLLVLRIREHLTNGVCV